MRSASVGDVQVLRAVRRRLLVDAGSHADDLAGLLPPALGDRRQALLRRAARRVVARLLLRSRAALGEPEGRPLAPVLARIFGAIAS